MNWISVKERLPENLELCNDNVLFFDNRNKQIHTGCYDYEFCDWQILPWANGNPKIDTENVTHWMPLPDHPKTNE